MEGTLILIQVAEDIEHCMSLLTEFVTDLAKEHSTITSQWQMISPMIYDLLLSYLRYKIRSKAQQSP